jgi:acetyl esterase/lipase
VITAGIDPLRSEGKELADRLKDVGIKVDYRNYDAVTHEFFGMGAVVDEAQQAEQQAAEGLKRAFGMRSTTTSQR